MGSVEPEHSLGFYYLSSFKPNNEILVTLTWLKTAIWQSVKGIVSSLERSRSGSPEPALVTAGGSPPREPGRPPGLLLHSAHEACWCLLPPPRDADTGTGMTWSQAAPSRPSLPFPEVAS